MCTGSRAGYPASDVTISGELSDNKQIYYGTGIRMELSGGIKKRFTFFPRHDVQYCVLMARYMGRELPLYKPINFGTLFAVINRILPAINIKLEHSTLDIV